MNSTGENSRGRVRAGENLSGVNCLYPIGSYWMIAIAFSLLLLVLVRKKRNLFPVADDFQATSDHFQSLFSLNYIIPFNSQLVSMYISQDVKRNHKSSVKSTPIQLW